MRIKNLRNLRQRAFWDVASFEAIKFITFKQFSLKIIKFFHSYLSDNDNTP